MDSEPIRPPEETRWVSHENGVFRSKIRFGSAQITMEELQRDWHDWSVFEQSDFACVVKDLGAPLRHQVLRFLIQNEPCRDETILIELPDAPHLVLKCEPEDTLRLIRGHLARSVANDLPIDESFPLLDDWCRTTRAPIGNILQALDSLSADNGQATIHWLYRTIWSNNALVIREGHEPCYVPWDLCICLSYMLRAGADPASLRPAYDYLHHHDEEFIRNMCERRLTHYFDDSVGR